MRQEGLKNSDISIFIKDRVEYIHSRIALKPLSASIEMSMKIGHEFGARPNTSFGKILTAKVKQMVAKVEKKLSLIYDRNGLKSGRSTRSIEFVGNLISKLFGNPGPEDWKQNTRNILAMKSAIERQLANSIELHHDIDQSRH